jgi:uncharacterized protein YmfQ (DUF2313 family)
MSAEERRPVPEDDLAAIAPAALADFEGADWPVWARRNCPVPTNEEWERQAASALPALRLAWLVMTRTKAETLELIRSMPDAATMEMIDAWEGIEGLLQPLISMAAAARLRVALAIGADAAQKIAELSR